MYAAHLGEGLFRRLPAGVLARAQDSVGAGQVTAGHDPRLVVALHDAFLAGFSTSCVVVGVVCLVGALGAVLWLPGREVSSPAPEDDEVVAGEPALVG